MSPYRQIPWVPIDAPVDGLPPIEVFFDIPQEAQAPNALQLKLLANIIGAFATLWNAMLEGLRRDYGYIEVLDGSFPLRHPESAITRATVRIPDWTKHKDDLSDKESWTLDTHPWSIYPVLVESILDLQFTEASFEGINLISLHLHW